MTTRFSKAVKTYDDFATAQSRCFDKLCTIITPLGPFSSILDIGCATGKNTSTLHSLFPDARTLGIDAEPAMIDAARLTYCQHPNLSFQTKTAINGIQQRSWDLIFSNATLQWLEHPEHFFKILRENKPRYFCFSVFVDDTFHELKRCLSDVLGKNVTLPIDTFPTGKEWLTLTQSSFEAVECTQTRHIQTYPSVLELLRHLSKTGVTRPFTEKKIWTPQFIRQLDSAFIKHFGMVRATYHTYAILAS